MRDHLFIAVLILTLVPLSFGLAYAIGIVAQNFTQGTFEDLYIVLIGYIVIFTTISTVYIASVLGGDEDTDESTDVTEE